jgi:hypothetical protein
MMSTQDFLSFFEKPLSNNNIIIPNFAENYIYAKTITLIFNCIIVYQR